MDKNNINIAHLGKYVLDGILSANNIMALYVLGNKPEDFKSVEQRRALKTTKSTTQGSFNGFDRFNIADEAITQKLSYRPKYYYQSIAVADTDLTENQKDANRAANLWSFKLESGVQDMIDSIGTLLYSTGTGNGGKDFTGVGAIIDDGTAVATLGGLTRSLYPVLKATRTAPGVGLTAQSQLRTTETATRKGGKVVNLHITTPTLWNTYETLLPITQQTNTSMVGYAQAGRFGKISQGGQGLSVNTGLNAIFFSGMPVVADDKCTSNYWYMINTSDLKWYGIQIKEEGWNPISISGGESIEGSVYDQIDSKNVGLSVTDKKVPVDQAGKVVQVVLGGDLISWTPWLHGVIQFT